MQLDRTYSLRRFGAGVSPARPGSHGERGARPAQELADETRFALVSGYRQDVEELPRLARARQVAVAELSVTPVVVAVVLTHNAPRALKRCLAALARQDRPADLVIVVDNASSPPVVGESLPMAPTVVRSDRNTGPAGGHHLGLTTFLATTATHAWVMDDDCVPDSASLGNLLIAVPAAGLVYPAWIDEQTGIRVDWPALVRIPGGARRSAAVGITAADFVWWAEDTEYLHWRIPEAGVTVAGSSSCGRACTDGSDGTAQAGDRSTTTRPATPCTSGFTSSRRQGGEVLPVGPVGLVRLGGGRAGGPAPLRDGGHGAARLVDGLLRRLGPRVPLAAAEPRRARTTPSSTAAASGMREVVTRAGARIGRRGRTSSAGPLPRSARARPAGTGHSGRAA